MIAEVFRTSIKFEPSSVPNLFSQPIVNQFARITYLAAIALRGETRVFHHLRHLKRLERLSSNDLGVYRERALGSLLAHAVENVPYYKSLRSKLGGGSNVSALDRLACWPAVEKLELVRDAANRTAPARQRTHIKSTGGSTGTPVRIIKDADGIARERAATWLALGWHEVGPGDRVARLWGVGVTAQARRKARYSDLAMNRRTISVFDIDDGSLERVWESLLGIRPVWIYGYADALHRLARWVEASGRNVSELRSRLIVSTGEPISEIVEGDLRRILRTPVQNEYGCGEVGAIAYECEAGSLHVMAANVHVEILRPDGTPCDLGEMGEVVVTDLTNYAQPLIRYRLGDRSALLPMCSCGLPWPTMQRVEGRAMDLILTPAGRRVYGALVTYHMRRISGDGIHFQQYQFVQVSPASVEVRICSQEEPPNQVTEELRRFSIEHLDGMSTTIKRVERIERERSGKLRIVKSEVTRNQPGN